MKVREVVETSSHHINGNLERTGCGRRLSAQTDLSLSLHLIENCMHSLIEKEKMDWSKLTYDRILHA
jgi:hypothetical protein